jgi:uncharacterized protein (TIGR03067 family)
MYRLCLVGAVVLIGSGTFAQDGTTGKDLKAFQGAWNAVSMKVGGREVVPGKAREGRLVVTKNEMLLTVGEESPPKAFFKLDATKAPREIDLGLVQEKKVSNRGIYELKGDMLTLCWGGDGKPRPTRFASTKEGSERLLVLKRGTK